MKRSLRHHILPILAVIICFAGTSATGQEPVVRRLPVSTQAANEFAPILHDSVLYFISNRKVSFVSTYVDQDDELLYSLFASPLNGDSTLGPAQYFSTSGQHNINNGPFIFSPNGTSLYITQNRTDRQRRSSNALLGIFKAEKRRGEWGIFKPLKFAGDGNFSVAHPALSPDGRSLYFVSDMEGGFGETDIYVSRKTGDEWGEPENLGGQINTPGKELFPFIHPSGLLFFTSSGHSKGEDLNIYSADLHLPEVEPIPLPAPINSDYDDFSCFIFQDTGRGYFASNRSGQDDLYEFNTPAPACNPIEVVKDNFCFTFFENGPFKSDTLPLVYVWDFGDGQSARGLQADHCFELPGEYNIELNVTDTLTNEKLFSVAAYNLKLEKTRQIWFNLPDTLKRDEVVILKAALQGFENQTEGARFYWDMGDGTHYIGETLSHLYRKIGKYRIVCSTKIEDGKEVCFFRDVMVVE